MLDKRIKEYDKKLQDKKDEIERLYETIRDKNTEFNQYVNNTEWFQEFKEYLNNFEK